MTPPTPTPSHGHRVGVGVLLGIGASLAFSTAGVFARPLFDAGWTPGAAALWRAIVSSVVMLPIGCWLLRGRFRLLLTYWRTLLAFGALAVVVAQLMFYAAVERMDVGVALLIEYMSPIALVALAWVRTRRRPAGLVLGGVVLSVAGLLFVLDLTGARPDPLGVGFALCGMVGGASYFLLSARPTELPPLALPAFGIPIGTALIGLAIAVGILPYSAPMVDVELLGAAMPWWIPVAVVGLIAAALAYSLGVAGIARAGERLSSFVGLFEVMFAVVLAWLLLGEQPSPVQLVGGLLIVAGIVLIRLAGDRHPAREADEVADLEAVGPSA